MMAPRLGSALLALTVLLPGCRSARATRWGDQAAPTDRSSAASEGPGPSGTGAGAEALAQSVPAAAGPGDCGLLSRSRVSAPAGLIVEQITHRSGSLTVKAVIVRPDDTRAHPVVLFAHGGFSGLGAPDWNAPAGVCSQCDLLKALAAAGYAVAASSYRGEDGSGGTVEVCQGEVDDVANLACTAAQQPWADGRFAVYGVSHGACVALRLAARDPNLRAAIAFVPPTNWGALYDGWQQQLALGSPRCLADTARRMNAASCAATYTHLSSEIRGALGGTPATQPAAYASRSLTENLPLRAPAILFYGSQDYIVDLGQACAARRALAARPEPFQAWYLDRSGQAVVNPGWPPACGGRFQSTPPPFGGTWPDGTLELVLEGEDHDVLASPLGTPGHRARAAAYQFLVAKMPP